MLNVLKKTMKTQVSVHMHKQIKYGIVQQLFWKLVAANPGKTTGNYFDTSFNCQQHHIMLTRLSLTFTY